MLRALFWIGEVSVVALVVIPVARFLLYQWETRRQEFYNRLSGDDMVFYLSRFHGQSSAGATAPPGPSQFDGLYNRLAGRRLYIVPAALMFLIVTIQAGLVTSTAIRAGYERYVLFYLEWVKHEGSIGEQMQMNHRAIDDLNLVVFPFPDVVLSLESLAAISGAYLYVFGVVIQGFRARTLAPSDLLWCSFRMLIAVPLGLSLAQVANASIGAFIAFALGAFPIEAINRILRHLVNKSLNQTEDETSDQLVKLNGVTPEVSAVLGGEGISAVQQLASVDPIALAVRSGLPFDYLLNLVAQSQAWCFLGSSVADLAPLGLGDSRGIAKLVKRLDSVPPDEEAHHVLEAASTAAKLDPPVLRSSFREIAGDRYTQFLLHVSE